MAMVRPKCVPDVTLFSSLADEMYFFWFQFITGSCNQVNNHAWYASQQNVGEKPALDTVLQLLLLGFAIRAFGHKDMVLVANKSNLAGRCDHFPGTGAHFNTRRFR